MRSRYRPRPIVPRDEIHDISYDNERSDCRPGLRSPFDLAVLEDQTYNACMIATDYRYLVRAPDVCQGLTVIEGTRIGVHDVVGLMINGTTVDEALRSFPDLTRSQVYECLAYYEDHRTEIDALVAEQMAEPGR
jgi:uncharacterized protein (DUF433 family)